MSESHNSTLAEPPRLSIEPLDHDDLQDLWSDAPETLDGHTHDNINEQLPIGEEGDQVDLEFGALPKLDKGESPAIDSAVGPSPTTGSLAQREREFDAASAHSLPSISVSASHSPASSHVQSTHSSTLASASLENARSNLRASVAGTTPSPTPSASQSRRSLGSSHRTTPEPISRSPNRLSGFFSNLIHRRDAHGLPPPSPLSPTSNDRAATPEGSGNVSRSSSPAPPPRPATPPPSLPPPSLRELGLSLSVLTNDLSPSHFSTPPASGAFLGPHHLLLCHAQGLDVLPLVAPPAPQPYALIRRVSFKSVVVMEHRGVLVAIAGRRDGVRVYALDEVKKAVEWRLDVEIRRERDRARREEAKRGSLVRDTASSIEKRSDAPPLTPTKPKALQRASSASSAMTTPRPTRKKSKSAQAPPVIQRHLPPLPPAPLPETARSPPPSYSTPTPTRPGLRAQHSAISLAPRRGSVTNVLSGTVGRRGAGEAPTIAQSLVRDGSEKADWQDASDDEEAINQLTAGPSGSQALDERTSAMATSSSSASNVLTTTPNVLATPTIHQSRRLSTATLTPNSRRRPPDLDLDAAGATPVRPEPPSPTPTLLTLRQALMGSPPQPTSTSPRARGPLSIDIDDELPSEEDADLPANGGGGGGNRTPTNERMTLAEALQESRIPDLPPPGSVVPQEAILLTGSDLVNSGDDDMPASPTASSHTRRSEETLDSSSRRRRRRWSVIDSIFAPNAGPATAQAQQQSAVPPVAEAATTTAAAPAPQTPRRSHMSSGRSASLSRSQSAMRTSSSSRVSAPTRPSTASGSVSTTASTATAAAASTSDAPPVPAAPSRFLSRIINNAFGSRKADEHSELPGLIEAKSDKRGQAAQAGVSPAPKLEYVKLPGTKGALLIKAVETNKKSFLAILCGENGEKVELFAGTYRTALGLSRTFILPDSPRSLELQLQGDDLVEVFLVFAQNVFGLEPATVRVREVRIGRAERRAARRRARELRGAGAAEQETPETESAPVEETTTVTVTVGVDPSGSAVAAAHDAAAANASANGSSGNVAALGGGGVGGTNATPAAGQDELLAVAAAQMGPYTTFQQLPFAPNFPLAAIADEYVIPPTYPDFLQYRAEHEPEPEGDVDLSQVQFTPPGLPVPVPAAPCNWYYRDPKGRVHGPWETARMEMWYKDGLLPTDLPVRREEEATYTLLKDLRQQSIDPTQPFKSAPPLHAIVPEPNLPSLHGAKPLLDPLSLLTQSRIFGPPALFYSTRGGHSTVIVDGRGRSVLKSRFVWSPDEDENRLGDVKRLEAFDVADRSVLVAMRQGGFEAVDFADALLRPADASRHVLPQFATTPSQVNRRAPFTWRIGSPAGAAAAALLPLKGHARAQHAPPPKKSSTGPGRSPAKPDFSGAGEGDNEHTRDEVVYLGRREDNVYICERNGGAFRILRLGLAGSGAP